MRSRSVFAATTLLATVVVMSRSSGCGPDLEGMEAMFRRRSRGVAYKFEGEYDCALEDYDIGTRFSFSGPPCSGRGWRYPPYAYVDPDLPVLTGVFTWENSIRRSKGHRAR